MTKDDIFAVGNKIIVPNSQISETKIGYIVATCKKSLTVWFGDTGKTGIYSFDKHTVGLM